MMKQLKFYERPEMSFLEDEPSSPVLVASLAKLDVVDERNNLDFWI